MEALLPLTKIPCILLATIGLQITVTPPHPPPAKSEEAPSTTWEVVLKQRGGPVVIKLICWIAALAQILFIIAQTFEREAFAGGVLNALGMREAPMPDASLYPSPMFLLGTCLASAGGYIRYCCYRELGHLFTFEMSIMKEHKLITTGPYAIVRHPAYTGAVCTIVGIVLLHSASGSWLIECGVLDSFLGRLVAFTFLAITNLIGVGLLKRIPKEEEALAGKFGAQWKEWAQKVPFRLFWGVY